MTPCSNVSIAAQIAAKSMISAGTKGGRIVFVGSFLALTTFVGYAGYAPGKYALKGKSFRNTSPDYRRGLIVVSTFLFRPGGYSAFRIPTIRYQRASVSSRRNLVPELRSRESYQAGYHKED